MKKITVISLSLILAGILLLMFGCAKSEESKTAANDTGSIIYGITTPPTGYAAFSTLSSLQSGDALKLRLNRTGTQIDEHTVYFDSIYDGGERLLLLKTDKKLIVGAGDSGSPVLTEEGKMVAALC